MGEQKISLKISKKFYCDTCDYGCCKLSEWMKHGQTGKHKRLSVANVAESKVIQYMCKCGKQYRHMSSLCKHKKTCNITIPLDTHVPEEHDKTDLITYLMKENKEFKEMLIEQNKIIMSMSQTHSSINNSNVNSHNKTFNLQFFLNETCKDAMNIMEFVDSVKLQLSDLETIGTTGFVNGISNIIIKNLKNLDVTKRPVHCTDSKREVLYVKDENKWEKENEEKKQMRKVINKISTKNIQQIPEWVEQNPRCKDSDSNKNTEYLHILSQSMGCTEPTNYDKIIHNVSKEVVVDK